MKSVSFRCVQKFLTRFLNSNPKSVSILVFLISAPTCRNVAVVYILLKVADLPRHIEQQPDGALKLEHFPVQAEIVLGTLGVGPHLVLGSVRISVDRTKKEIRNKLL